MRFDGTNEEMLDALMERVRYWTDDEDTIALFEQMYEHCINEGFYSGNDFDVQLIVDNDYINWCEVVEAGDDGFEDVDRAYNNGECDVDGKCVIEAEYGGKYLVRW